MNRKLLFVISLLFVRMFAHAQTPAYSSNVSYVRSWDAKAPDQNPAALKGRLTKDVNQTTQYLDGLGRAFQVVTKEGSAPTVVSQNSLPKYDLVKQVVYDPFGREAFTYMPFAANGSTHLNDGEFKTNPLIQQLAFCQAQYPGESSFFSSKNFETSPLERVLKAMPQGSSWSGNGKGTELKYWKNTTTDYVRAWDVQNSITAGVFGSYSINTVVANGSYPAGSLDKTATVDENGKQVIEFKSKEGQVILKKVQLTGATDNGTGTGYTGWICTYYIYDDLGQLRCVIQPDGVNKLTGNGWQLNTSLLAEQCFRYEYDSRGRMIMKKVPGVGEVYMVYDAQDKLVLSQDAKMRLQNQWLVNKYDVLNRPIETGLWTSLVSFSDHLALANASSNYPVISGTYEALTITHYDNYTGLPAGLSDYLTTWNYNLQPTDNSYWPYPQMPAKSTSIQGMVAWTQVKVIGTTTFLNQVNYYDEKGRVIQTQATNLSGGLDVTTTQYTWAGQPLATVQRQQKAGTVSPTELIILTKIGYDELGRILNVKKTINGTVNGVAVSKPEVEILKNEYDRQGQLKTKKIGKQKDLAGNYTVDPLETLNYDYNVRGWILGVNRDYAKDANNSNYFGFDLGYDKQYNGIMNNQSYKYPQLNGNISGMVWKSKGDGIKRKYDFVYDETNRLKKAEFSQYSANLVFDQSDGVNYDMIMGDDANGIPAYDANGNIMKMRQWGLKITGSALIDNMTYSYYGSDLSKTNRLMSVSEASGSVNNNLGDFTDNNTTGADYDYDANGNLLYDKNKAINAIAYNYLNLPQTVNFGPKGTITYVYDAAGKKLRKIVQDNTGVAKTTTTEYIAGSVYENDILQFFGQEEGRVRYKASIGTVPASFEYDYMIKDHLGNVRMVLTDELKKDVYPLVSLETSKINIESAYYTIDQSKVELASNLSPAPSSYLNDNGIGNNPPDNAFSATYSQKLYKTNSGTNKTGLGITLKVMAGDRIDIFGKSYYIQNNTGGSGANAPLGVTDILSGLLGTPGNITGGAHTNLVELSGVQAVTGPLGGTLFLTNPNRNDANFQQRPRAFINYVFLDEQFRFTDGGFSPVSNSPGLKDHGSDLYGKIAPKNGYIYIYVSNESPVNVYFDNLQVVHTRGPILEETHYYPFGLTMAGVSSKALNSTAPANRLKFNGKEEQKLEFGDGSGLDVLDFGFRINDAQIGRFWQIDPLSNDMPQNSVYSLASNNPIEYIDFMGLSPFKANSTGYISTTYVDKHNRVLDVVNDGKTDIIRFDDIDINTWNPNKNKELQTRKGGRLIGRTIYWYDFMSLNEGNGTLGNPLYGVSIQGSLTFWWTSLFKVFQNKSLIKKNTFGSGTELISALNQDWNVVLKNYFSYLLALKCLGSLSGHDQPYDIKKSLINMNEGYLYSPGINGIVLPVFTTGRALGNILFGMNMSSVSDMSWSDKQSVWDIAMNIVGKYNETDGVKISDRYYYGEHPYSGSYIYYGFWGALRSSY